MNLATAKKKRPIRIIGGGLAGLFLGLGLRRAGVPTTVEESGAYPRHRVCGEFMAGAGGESLARAGLRFDAARFPRHRETRWFVGGRPILRARLPREALGVSRHTLDQTLAHAFRAAGGTLIENHRANLDAAARPGTVLATGRRAHPSAWIGLKAHFTGLPARDLAVHLGRRAYVGVSPVENERVNVCGLFRKRPDIKARREEALFAHLHAAGLTHLAADLRKATIVRESFSGVAAFSFAPDDGKGDALSLGDRWGVIPPFTGDGMSLALESAEAALPFLLAYADGSAPWRETLRGVRGEHARRFAHRFRWARTLHPFLLHPAGRFALRLALRGKLLPFRFLYQRTHAPLP